MSKDDILFAIIGLLLGFIIGYLATNSYNLRAAQPAAANAAPAANGTAPANNGAPPDMSAQPGGGGPAPADPQVMAAAQQRAQAQPNDFDAQMQAGDVFYQAKRFKEAADFFTKANQLKPDALEPMIALGNTYYDDAQINNANDKWPQAEKWYTAALAKDDKNVSVRTDLGLTFLFRQPPNYDRALQEFRKSLEVNPNHEPTLQNVIVAYTEKKDAAQAKAALAKLEQVNPNNSALPSLREGVTKLGGGK